MMRVVCGWQPVSELFDQRRGEPQFLQTLVTVDRSPIAFANVQDIPHAAAFRINNRPQYAETAQRKRAGQFVEESPGVCAADVHLRQHRIRQTDQFHINICC